MVGMFRCYWLKFQVSHDVIKMVKPTAMFFITNSDHETYTPKNLTDLNYYTKGRWTKPKQIVVKWKRQLYKNADLKSCSVQKDFILIVIHNHFNINFKIFYNFCTRANCKSFLLDFNFMNEILHRFRFKWLKMSSLKNRTFQNIHVLLWSSSKIL